MSVLGVECWRPNIFVYVYQMAGSHCVCSAHVSLESGIRLFLVYKSRGSRASIVKHETHLSVTSPDFRNMQQTISHILNSR